MLRLWRESSPESGDVIKVEGQIMGEWVALVERECDGGTRDRRPVSLDLGDVTFVDGRGLVMLRSLLSRSVRFVNVTPLLQDQLNEKGETK